MFFPNEQAVRDGLGEIEVLSVVPPKPAQERRGLAKVLDRFFPKPPVEQAPTTVERPIAQDEVERLLTLARPGARLERMTAGSSHTRSHLGGLPDLRDPSAWPVGPPDRDLASSHRWFADAKGREATRDEYLQRADHCSSEAPLSFIGQFDFAGLNPEGTLPNVPKSGLLSLFYNSVGKAWDESKAFAVLWEPDPSVLRRVESLPPGLEGKPDAEFPESPLRAETGLFMPDGDDLDLGELGLEEDPEIAYSEWQAKARYQAGPVDHRLGGRVQTIQNCMQSEDPKTGARAQPLLQISSDRDHEMMWGDMGNVYLWLWPTDLEEGRLERAMIYMQTS